MGQLRGKVALVTGASRGLGRAIAVAFSEAGASVAVTARTQPALDAVVARLEATGRVLKSRGIKRNQQVTDVRGLTPDLICRGE